jgi:hypothetical protein
MSLATQIQLRVTANRAAPQDLQVASAPMDFNVALALPTGVGANQADEMISDELTIAGAATQDLDFAGGGLLNPFGVATTLVKVKLILVVADPTNTTTLTLQPKAGAALPFLTGTTPATSLKPGGVFFLYDPSAAGIAVGPGATDAISLVNAAGASAKVKVVVIGTLS